jgi:tyrosinase
VRIDYQRSGGVAGVMLRGTVDTAEVPPADAAELHALVKDADLDRLAAHPDAPSADRDRFQYDLAITTPDGGRRQLTLHEGELTPQARALVDRLEEHVIAQLEKGGPVGTQQGGAVHVREDVLSLGAWGDVLLWYARGVADMQSRPIGDPTSWTYQAAVHGHDPATEDPDNWNQCQHGSWYFLPWHRAYLGWFEQMVRAAVVKLGGPDSWALPYWNYSSQTEANPLTLPQAFRDQTMPDGTPNPLRVEERNPGLNDGRPVTRRRADVDVSALDQPDFAAAALGGAPGFGGPVTTFHHDPGRFGALENVPHGSIHVDVGGDMAAFETAALDPIFWLHHANIDRLWEVWRQNAAHQNPGTGDWLDFQFTLHDATGAPVTFRARDVLDTTSALFSYRYDDVSDPRQPAAAAPPEAVVAANRGRPPNGAPPEMVGATLAPVTLGADPVAASLRVEAPSGPAREGVAADPRRVYLNVENVTGERASTNYGVYLNLPEGAVPAEDDDEHLAGVLSTFGVDRASRPDDAHGGGGLHVTFDITDLVARLQEAAKWDPRALQVTFVPHGEAAQVAPVRVGRVSLYYH